MCFSINTSFIIAIITTYSCQYCFIGFFKHLNIHLNLNYLLEYQYHTHLNSKFITNYELAFNIAIKVFSA